MSLSSKIVSCILVALLCPWLGVRSQQPVRPGSAHAASAPEPVFSIGQPPVWRPYAAAFGMHDTRSDGIGGDLTLGVQRALTNPVGGLAGAAGEIYGSVGGAFDGGGGRLLVRSDALALSLGLDFNVGHGRARRSDLLLSWQGAIRRGGLFGGGTMLRLDWLPTRGRALRLGVTLPVMQPLAGRTRRRSTDARLPSAPPDDGSLPPAGSPVPEAAERALAVIERNARRIGAFASVYNDRAERLVTSSPVTFAGTAAEYAAALSRAFAAAAGGREDVGDALARRARACMLDEVIVPYDSLFGQVKDPAGTIEPLVRRARSRFVRWLRDSSRVPAANVPAAAAVHARWLAAVQRVHRDLVDHWRHDSRMVWLPLTLALTPDQYDDQAEVDALVARVVGRPFTEDNAFTYLRSSDLPLEVARTIFAARDYHVLWMHDFTGIRETGAVDRIGYEMVADAYLPALTAAVQRFDSTGVIPLYMIVLDQYFYEPRRGRIWMSMLEHPLDADMRLPDGESEREAHLRLRQRRLRDAVAGSRRLQREASSSGEADWLRGIVKVHVNVTQPADFSFRSVHIVPPVPFTPDNVMRDHRKLVVYDLNEYEPYRGAMILMGIGIGEHYATATWQDRGYRLRGPAALEARAAIVRNLRRNGFRERDIPPPLRPVGVPGVTRNTAARDYAGRALQVHNEVGFGRKESSIARALLYELAQPGSTVIVPDPVWLSEEWAAMLAGAAARGARVHVVAPSVGHAPSAERPLMAAAHDVLARLIRLRASLASTLLRSGGELRVGIYAGEAPMDDPIGRAREVREGLLRSPWIRELMPFDERTIEVLDLAEARTADGNRVGSSSARDLRPRAPKLHQKTQLIARPGAIGVLARQPGWDDAIAASMRSQSIGMSRFAEQLAFTTPSVDTAAMRGTDALLLGFEEALPEWERERVSFYFTVGTQNQDPRGMVSDGEASLIISGSQGAAGLVDLYFVMARSTWVSDRTELERYLPRQPWYIRWVARLVRAGL